MCDKRDSYQVEVCVWEPIDGSRPQSVEWLERMVAFIDEQRRAGATTYVHCLAGMNRSSMVVAAYLMYEHTWTRDEAVAFIRSKRPQVQPNPVMMRILADWEQALKQSAEKTEH